MYKIKLALSATPPGKMVLTTTPVLRPPMMPNPSPDPSFTRSITSTWAHSVFNWKRIVIKLNEFGFIEETCLIEESPNCNIRGKHLRSLVFLGIGVRPSSTASYILFHLQWVNMENDIITLYLINRLFLFFLNIMCNE